VLEVKDLEERSIVCRAMERFGGGFASALGIALARADYINAAKIKITWPELWEYYLEMGKKMEAKNADKES